MGKCCVVSLIVAFLIAVFEEIQCTDLTDVTDNLFYGNSSSGLIAAYGDYNADKLVDIFVIAKSTALDILEARENKAHELKHLITHLPPHLGNSNITAVIPTDFNGDALMDVLLTTQPAGDPNSKLTILIYWGTDEGHVQRLDETPLILPQAVRDQPTLFDFNQDMLPDLLVETPEGQRVVFLSNATKNFTLEAFPESGENGASPFLFPHSNAFVDLTGDYFADLFLTTKDGYEIWTFQAGTWEHNKTVSLPVPNDGTHNIGQATFADIDRDGFSNLLVPVCKNINGHCVESAIHGYSFGEGTNSPANWSIMFNNFKFSDQTWDFVPKTSTSISWLPAIPVTLRMGDYNMDGYPDMIVFLHSNKLVQNAVLLTNVPCGHKRTCFLDRTLEPDLDTGLEHYTGAVLGSLFDIYEDGIPDILLVTLTSAVGQEELKPVIRAFKQTSTTDTCFIKVTVTSGLCYKDCLYARQPYGVNTPGPAVKYNTISVNGNEQRSSGTQLSQSTHFSLQLPYVFFGLGLTPNFVDEIGVGIPATNSKGKVLEREWTQIIPNSQLVVIPYPYRQPSRWIVKLFVTPSQSVLITGAVLLGTCGFVAGIIGIFHWRERREDQKEKRQESHKFHFDAM